MSKCLAIVRKFGSFDYDAFDVGDLDVGEPIVALAITREQVNSKLQGAYDLCMVVVIESPPKMLIPGMSWTLEPVDIDKVKQL